MMRCALPCTSALLSVSFALALAGCGSASPNSGPTIKPGTGVGGICARQSDCQMGLSCDTSTHSCQPNHSTIQDAPCTRSAECMSGFYCAQSSAGGKCEPAGNGVLGDACSDDSQCASGLLCASQGLAGTCAQPGTGDVNSGCTRPTDCMAGLLCVAGTCRTASQMTPWTGATCDSTEASVPTVLFHVPRAGEPASTDFYRLPFPNDIRARNGRIDLKDHPRPGPRILPFDLVDRYLGAIEQDSTGFGVNQAIYLRFSRAPDFNSFQKNGIVALINITPASPEYGLPSGLSWTLSTSGTRYVCDRFMTIRPPFGHPLRPGTTYAAVLNRQGTDATGTPFGPDSDFAAMLSASIPADPDLAAAWSAYAPLRAYLADDRAPTKLVAADLAVAVVFTTEKIEDPFAAIQAAVAAAPAPALSTLVHCNDPGVVSPCDDGLTGATHQRGCFAAQLANASFDEYQGTISLPVFQQGTPPYLDPEDGGGIMLAGDGKASIVRNEAVCISLAIPHGTPPAAGWPLVVYSHGTGGSFRSAVELGLAEDYAKGAAAGGAAVAMATLGYEGILHGRRRGASTQDPGALVYNFLNPRAARDNALQAAADLLAIPRALGGLAGQAFSIDPAHVALYGHSQGGNAASLAATVADYGAAVLSGTGGTLIFTLLQKKNPVDVGTILPLLLAEDSVDANHPVLNLMQMYFERSDSVNFARYLYRHPHDGIAPRHALHVYGTDDSYAPVETQRRYAEAAELPVALPLVDNYPTDVNYGMGTVAPPIKANQHFGILDDLVTVAQIQYEPVGYDGHFVSTQNPSGRAAIQEFLVSFMRDDAPTIQP